MNRRRQAAISRSQIARQAKPMGEMILQAMQAKLKGAKDPLLEVIPPFPQKKQKQRSQPENKIVRECLQWLKANGIFAWRNNSGELYVNGRPIRFGFPGSGDILGILPTGRFLSIECKVPGRKVTLAQQTFIHKINNMGGLAIVVHSAEELSEKIQEPKKPF